jgi:hypothetical protein
MKFLFFVFNPAQKTHLYKETTKLGAILRVKITQDLNKHITREKE